MIDPQEELRGYRKAEYLDKHNLKIVDLTPVELIAKRNKKKEEELAEDKTKEQVRNRKITEENNYQLFLRKNCIIKYSDEGIPEYEFKHFFSPRMLWDSFSLREYYFDVIMGICKNPELGKLTVINKPDSLIK
jgi:hypothetical protein